MERVCDHAPAWSDPSSAWWAKANRANEHLDELGGELITFRGSNPYSVTPEPTEVPDRLAYRLRFYRLFPIRLSTIVGDVVSNLRGALECLAFSYAGGGRTRRWQSASMMLCWAGWSPRLATVLCAG
jgi:hypothetical protein